MVKFTSEIASKRNIEIECLASLIEYKMGGYYVSERIPDDVVHFLQEVTSPTTSKQSVTVQSNNVTEGRLNTLFVKLSLNFL